MFLATIIGDKDDQQWRCWLENITISSRDLWRDFVKNSHSATFERKGGQPTKLFMNIQLYTTYMAGGLKGGL